MRPPRLARQARREQRRAAFAGAALATAPRVARLLALLATAPLGACTGPQRPAPELAPTPEAAPAPLPTPPAPALAPPATALTELPGVTDLPPDTPLPVRARATAKLVAGKRFTDASGDNFVFLLEQRSDSPGRGSTVAMYAYGVVRDGGKERALWHWREVEAGCHFTNVSGVLATSLTITDADADGLAEVSWTHASDCASHQRPLQLVRRGFEGADAYALVGHADATGLAPTPIFTPERPRWPPRLAAAAVEVLTTSAAAFATPALADLPPLLPAELEPPAQQVRFTVREFRRARGRVDFEISYPVFRLAPSSAAARLNAELADFVGIDSRPGPDLVGSHEASCEPTVISSRLLAVECRHLIDLRTRREQAAGTGGSPGDYTRRIWQIWLLPELPPVDPLELLGDPALAGACAPLLTTGGLRLTADGLAWEPALGNDYDQTAPPGCDLETTIEYAAMKPRTARATRFIAEMLGPADVDDSSDTGDTD